jgi:hypothetical protein
MSIPGYERPWQVRAQLEALKHERKSHIYSERHLAEIKRQENIFKAELKRMAAEGVEDEPAATNPALGTAGWVGSLDHQYTDSQRR